MSKDKHLSSAQKLKKQNQRAARQRQKERQKEQQPAKCQALATQQQTQIAEKALVLVKTFYTELLQTNPKQFQQPQTLSDVLRFALYTNEQARQGSQLHRLVIKFGSDLSTLLEMTVEDDSSVTTDVLLELVHTYQYPQEFETK